MFRQRRRSVRPVKSCDSEDRKWVVPKIRSGRPVHKLESGHGGDGVGTWVLGPNWGMTVDVGEYGAPLNMSIWASRAAAGDKRTRDQWLMNCRSGNCIASTPTRSGLCRKCAHLNAQCWPD